MNPRLGATYMIVGTVRSASGEAKRLPTRLPDFSTGVPPISGPLLSFTSDEISRVAPVAAGVYALWKDDTVIFYGSADVWPGLRARLLAHLQGDEGEGTRGASHFQVESSMVRCTPINRQAELLREYFRLHRQFPSCNSLGQ